MATHDDERTSRRTGDPSLPRFPALLLRLLVAAADRDEVLEAMAEEYAMRIASGGRWRARLWVWRQALRSVPALVGQRWWQAWSGFRPRTDSMNPGDGMFERAVMDLRFALRRLRRRPTYTVLTVLTLALGVSGTAAVYGIAQQLLLEPLPTRDEDEVAVFWSQGNWSEAEFTHVRPEIEGFRSVAAIMSGDATLVRANEPARLVRGISASAELFDVMGVEPLLGAGFRPGDDVPGAEPVAVLSHTLWRELGSDPDIVGRSVELAGIGRTVLGVMPPGFWFRDPMVRVWLAADMDPENGTGNYTLVGRLAEGRSIDQMGGVLQRVTRALEERFDYPDPRWSLTLDPHLTPLRDDVVGPVRPAVLALMGAMVVLLLIAGVNVAALMLGQVDSRSTELAVRSALGAGRSRLVRQVVVDSLVIGGLAGAAGALLALLGFPFLVAALPLGALAETASVDWSLLWASLVSAVLASGVVALVPAVSVARGEIQGRLRDARTGSVAGRGGRVEGGLVVVQVALVLLLSAGSALLIRSVGKLRLVEPGVDVERVAVAEVLMPVSTPRPERAQIVREMVEAVEALPGVVAAGSTQKLPLRNSGDNWGMAVEGRPDLEGTNTAFRIVTPDYFRTMGIRVSSGRGLMESDREIEGEGTVVVNRALAERYFPGEDPLGVRIAMSNRWDRIVGVVEDVTEGGDLRSGTGPARYMVYEQVPFGTLPGQTIVVRTREGVDPVTLLEPTRRALQAAVPGVAIRELTTMQNVFDQAVGPAQQVMALLTLLSGLALTLGVVGVYGVVSHFVTRRRRDWGVRMALGMRPERVRRQIVWKGGLLVGTGAVVGIVAFLALARLLATFLYEVQPTDAGALLAATATLMTAGLVSAWVPALRASRIDPARVLREE